MLERRKESKKQTVLTADGKFSQDNLWKETDERYPNAQITKKSDFFRWSRDWGFADEKAGEDPSKYVNAISCLVQDQAAAGLMIDIEASQSDMLVAFPTATPMSPPERDYLKKFAKRVLGLKVK